MMVVQCACSLRQRIRILFIRSTYAAGLAVVKQETKQNVKLSEIGSHTQNIDSDCTWL